MSSLDPEQRSRLLAAKLGALVASRVTGDVDADIDADGAVDADAGPSPRPAVFGGGAALVDGASVWVLVQDAEVGLGAVLAWADQQGAVDVHLIVDGDAGGNAGDLARQAELFTQSPRVYRVHGRDLVAVDPAPPAPVPEPPAVALALVGELRAAGLDVIVEHGVVTGEVLGLEVARVVIADDGTAGIEVGVGRNDREAFGMLHGDLPTADALRSVVDTVRRSRRPDAPAHPLNRLAGERWLRSHLIEDPGRLGTWTLEPVPGPIARQSVNERLAAFAAGRDADGQAVVLACSVGIDLDLIPIAADVREQIDPSARLVIAVPARDAHPVTQRLAAALDQPAEILPIEGDWRR